MSEFDQWLEKIQDPKEKKKILQEVDETAYWFFDERGHTGTPDRQELDTQTSQRITMSKWEKSHPNSGR